MRRFKNYKLNLIGFGRDINGNSIIKLRFDYSRGFSIQINNGCFKHTYNCMDRNLSNILDYDLDIIESEIVEYLNECGTKKQKISLRLCKLN